MGGAGEGGGVRVRLQLGEVVVIGEDTFDFDKPYRSGNLDETLQESEESEESEAEREEGRAAVEVESLEEAVMRERKREWERTERRTDRRAEKRERESRTRAKDAERKLLESTAGDVLRYDVLSYMS